jgi:3-methyladenine DNA glycosylase AlkD
MGARDVDLFSKFAVDVFSEPAWILFSEVVHALPYTNTEDDEEKSCWTMELLKKSARPPI